MVSHRPQSLVTAARWSRRATLARGEICYDTRMNSSSSPFAEPRAVYVHVPFCAHRCGYCDFTLVAGKDHLIGDYLRALQREMETLELPREVDTLFIGGGTPSHLPPRELEQLLQLIGRWFQRTAGYEFSIEVNPAGLTADKIDILAEQGVNRVSLGVQSFDDRVLQFLERDHDAVQVEHVVSLLKPRIANISLDLIFGVPGQSLQLWRETMQRALALGPQHVSTYGLTFEKGTSFWTRRSKGEIAQLPDELERQMYAAAMDDLAVGGFEQYELSNFGKPGYQCRHNHVYWAAKSYFGFGPGAARYIDGKRITNHRSVTHWLQRMLAGQEAAGDAEELSAEDRARETIVLGMRRMTGIDRTQFREQTGFDLDQLAGDIIRRKVANGLLVDDGVSVRLTREGQFLADSVIVDFL